MEIYTDKAQIILAIKAIRTSKKLSRRSIAKLYKVPKTTLRDRIAGQTPRSETRPNCYKLSELEEQVIV